VSKLTSRGLNGLDALKCCTRQQELNELTLRGFLSELLSEVLQINSTGADNQVLSFVPLKTPSRVPQRIVRIVRTTRGAPLIVGAVVLLTAFALGGLLQRLATMETLRGIIDALDYLLPNDCERCIKKALWKQTNPEFTVREVHRTRLP
jgi:hypothetical protein